MTLKEKYRIWKEQELERTKKTYYYEKAKDYSHDMSAEYALAELITKIEALEEVKEEFIAWCGK